MKKMLSRVLVVALLITMATAVMPPFGTAAVQSGDVNSDGKINASDATRILLSVVGKISLNPDQSATADVDQDGDVRASDATQILLHVVGKKPIDTTPLPDERIDFLEEISDENFLGLVIGYESEIYQSLYTIDGNHYGRVIASSSSAEDAVNVCTRHFTDERYSFSINTVVECKVIYESDIMYGVYVRWEHQDYPYEENVISFKESAADITVRNVVYGDEESYRICTSTEEQIKQIALYLFHDKNFTHTVLDYKTLSNSDEYRITVYTYEVCYGDWGVPDQYTLFKHSVVVDKITGEIEFQEPIPLKTVIDESSIIELEII